MAIARAAGKLRGRKPKLSPTREALMVDLHHRGEKNPGELAELFGIGRATVYRALQRAQIDYAVTAGAATSTPSPLNVEPVGQPIPAPAAGATRDAGRGAASVPPAVISE